MVHLTTALDPASAVPLYEQLYRSLAAEMRAGTLTAGTRMPGKRRLAAELSVSVNTVDTAYQMLAAEGYLTARERSGFTVQEYLALPQGGIAPGIPGGEQFRCGVEQFLLQPRPCAEGEQPRVHAPGG